MKVFIDTSAFIALLVETEEYHPLVTQSYEGFKKKRALFFTSDYVLDELFTRVLYDFGKNFAIKIVKIFQNAIATEELKVLHINPSLFSKSFSLFTKYTDHKISFTDITSFVLFKEFKLETMFTLDTDFRKFRIVLSPI